MRFLVGTLTREGGCGILHCNLEGNRIKQDHCVFLTDPNYLITVGNRVYSVSSDATGEFKGCVNELTADRNMMLLARSETLGNAPCHLCSSPDQRHLYCANYGTGSLSVFSIESGLDVCIQCVVHEGCGPHPVRQTGPHIHHVSFIPGTNYLLAVDLGIDSLVVYRANPQTGILTFHSTTHLLGGPRHAAYASSSLGYICHELSNEVTVCTISDGVFTPIKTLSTVPYPIEKSTAAAIRVGQAHGHLYVSNRGHGTIAVYDLDVKRMPSSSGYLPAGSFPRDFLVLKDGRFLVADQHTGLHVISAGGKTLDFFAQKGTVCICPIG